MVEAESCCLCGGRPTILYTHDLLWSYVHHCPTRGTAVRCGSFYSRRLAVGSWNLLNQAEREQQKGDPT